MPGLFFVTSRDTGAGSQQAAGPALDCAGLTAPLRLRGGNRHGWTIVTVAAVQPAAGRLRPAAAVQGKAAQGCVQPQQSRGGDGLGYGLGYGYGSIGGGTASLTKADGSEVPGD
jgi:hypothetical protein